LIVHACIQDYGYGKKEDKKYGKKDEYKKVTACRTGQQLCFAIQQL